MTSISSLVEQARADERHKTEAEIASWLMGKTRRPLSDAPPDTRSTIRIINGQLAEISGAVVAGSYRGVAI